MKNITINKESHIKGISIEGTIMTVIFKTGTYEYYGVDIDKFKENFSEEGIKSTYAGSYGKAVKSFVKGLKYKKIS